MRIRTAVFQADTSDCRQRLRSNRLASLYNKRVCVCGDGSGKNWTWKEDTEGQERGLSSSPVHKLDS